MVKSGGKCNLFLDKLFRILNARLYSTALGLRLSLTTEMSLLTLTKSNTTPDNSLYPST
jgi:hypothetical protein